MNILFDMSQHLVGWTTFTFLLTGILLLSCALRQMHGWNQDLVGYQLNAVFGASKRRAALAPVSMFNVLPLPMLHIDQDEMQVVEGEDFV